MPQASRAGHAGALERAEWAAETLNICVNRFFPHDGHEGFSFARNRNSNSWPHSLQVYS
jgi:hypothetical protein